jgi:hypothetical protein
MKGPYYKMRKIPGYYWIVLCTSACSVWNDSGSPA